VTSANSTFTSHSAGTGIVLLLGGGLLGGSNSFGAQNPRRGAVMQWESNPAAASRTLSAHRQTQPSYDQVAYREPFLSRQGLGLLVQFIGNVD
jgi:hypothetical protein